MAKKKIIGKQKKKNAWIIVKRRGHLELYDEKKAYGSCYFACRSAHLSEQESESICEKVCKAVANRLQSKREVSSDEIFNIVAEELEKHNEDASFMYKTHRDIS